MLWKKVSPVLEYLLPMHFSGMDGSRDGKLMFEILGPVSAVSSPVYLTLDEDFTARNSDTTKSRRSVLIPAGKL
jgi:hypothetical protein